MIFSKGNINSIAFTGHLQLLKIKKLVSQSEHSTTLLKQKTVP